MQLKRPPESSASICTDAIKTNVGTKVSLKLMEKMFVYKKGKKKLSLDFS